LRLATSSAKLGIFERDIRQDRTIWVNDRMYEIFRRSAQDEPLSKALFFRKYDVRAFSSDEINWWDETEACLEHAQREIRTFSYLMHPPTLQTDKLVASIGQFIAGFADRIGLDIKMGLSPQARSVVIPDATRAPSRHSGGTGQRASSRRGFKSSRQWPGRRWTSTLIISDDGRGFQGEQSAGVGRGIRGMQDRTRRWGGELRIRTGPKGTTVHVVWPVHR
jgi:signal transduction histidine kinase